MCCPAGCTTEKQCVCTGLLTLLAEHPRQRQLAQHSIPDFAGDTAYEVLLHQKLCFTCNDAAFNVTGVLPQVLQLERNISLRAQPHLYVIELKPS